MNDGCLRQALKGHKKPTGDPTCPPQVVRAKRIQRDMESRMAVQTLQSDEDDNEIVEPRFTENQWEYGENEGLEFDEPPPPFSHIGTDSEVRSEGLNVELG